jgi:hypothetical protein
MALCLLFVISLSTNLARFALTLGFLGIVSIIASKLSVRPFHPATSYGGLQMCGNY